MSDEGNEATGWSWDGGKARTMRERARMSRIDAAKALGFSDPEVIRRHEVPIERRTVVATSGFPRTPTVCRMADLYNCAPGDFFSEVVATCA